MSETHAWNPGIQSQLPMELMPLHTLARPENVFESLDELQELKGFCGLDISELATFRPQRLVVHELLIRIAADYSVSDGDDYEDLGINFRQMAGHLLDQSLAGQMQQIEQYYHQLRQEVRKRVDDQLGSTLFRCEPGPQPEKQNPKKWWQPWRKKPDRTPATESPFDLNQQLQDWTAGSADQFSTELESAVNLGLARVIGSIVVKHGQSRGEQELLTRLVTNHACNTWCSIKIGELIQPWIKQGAKQAGYRPLPSQDKPVIMNVKGASAAGKSTLRPLQQKLTRRLGLNWEDFALISPDIFRKFLLDYESLGDAFKYAGTLSGLELQIVDQKLDGYMARKAREGSIPHLLIDRFRFDSFAAKSREEGSNLLTRFGSRVFMFYVVTPPHATVERAWIRGLQVGRFKAVDDLLDHNIEAFNGMPQLFFTWALDRDKDVYHEFLDNSVEKGGTPRTIAFGENGQLTILDVERIMDINRFQKLNVNAQSAEDAYQYRKNPDRKARLKFLKSCIQQLPIVEFADFDTGEIYASVTDGRLTRFNQGVLDKAIGDEETRQLTMELLHSIPSKLEQTETAPDEWVRNAPVTLGTWGARNALRNQL